MTSKQQLQRDLTFIRGLTYAQWIDFGEYLLDNDGSDSTREFYKSLSQKFIMAAKVDIELNPRAELLALPADYQAKEDRLRLAGWK